MHAGSLEMEFKNPQVSVRSALWCDCYIRITDSICEFLCQIYAVSNEEVPTYKTTAVAKSVDLYTYEILLSVTVSKMLYDISPNSPAARNAHSLYVLHICSGVAYCV